MAMQVGAADAVQKRAEADARALAKQQAEMDRRGFDRIAESAREVTRCQKRLERERELEAMINIFGCTRSTARSTRVRVSLVGTIVQEQGSASESGLKRERRSRPID